MDSLLTAIQNAPKKGGDEHLRKVFDESVVSMLSKHPEYVGVLLENLDVTKHSAAWCYALSCGGLKKGDAARVWMNQVEVFLSEMRGEQVRNVCSDKLAGISSRYAETCRAMRCPGRGIPYLLRGLHNLAASPNDLTPFHPDYLCLCLLQKQYNQAKDVLMQPILTVDPPATGVTPTHMMLYYYYGARVHIGLKNFKAAIACLETCMCTPSTCLTSITLQAYKKYLLCSLVDCGKVPPALPKHCPLGVVKVVRKYTQVYVDFQSLFAVQKVEEKALEDYVRGHAEVFKTDGNLGLARQAVRAHRNTFVAQIVGTYKVISLSDFSQTLKISTEDSLQLLSKLIESNRLTARIDLAAQMLHFEERLPTCYDTSDILNEMQQLKCLTETVQERDEGVQVSREYTVKELYKDPDFKDQYSSQKSKKNIVDAMFRWSFN